MDSIFKVAKCIIEGFGTRADSIKGLSMVKSAALKRHPEASIYYANHILSSKPPDFHQAIETLLACDSSESIFQVGKLYQFGLPGLDRNIPKAILYYTRAAKASHPKAQLNLAMLYQFLEEKERPRKSFDLYSKAASSGDLDANYFLALNHLKGFGCEVNWQAGKDMLQKGVESGHMLSIHYLANIYSTGLFKEEIDITRANELVLFTKKMTSFAQMSL